MKKLSNFKSQAGQDLFALSKNDYKVGGTFLEIGAYDSESISNTYVLEVEYGWTGLAIEIIPERAEQYISKRSSPCIVADATKLDYKKLLMGHELPQTIDYLSLDIEPATQTLEALEKILESGYEFKTITFEHDLYVSKDNLIIKNKQKEILLDKGYVLYKENVCSQNNPRFPFEDWWVK